MFILFGKSDKYLRLFLTYCKIDIKKRIGPNFWHCFLCYSSCSVDKMIVNYCFCINKMRNKKSRCVWQFLDVLLETYCFFFLFFVFCFLFFVWPNIDFLHQIKFNSVELSFVRIKLRSATEITSLEESLTLLRFLLKILTMSLFS